MDATEPIWLATGPAAPVSEYVDQEVLCLLGSLAGTSARLKAGLPMNRGSFTGRGALALVSYSHDRFLVIDIWRCRLRSQMFVV